MPLDQRTIDAVFHPERPVTEPSQLIGRDTELEIAVARLSTAGGHLLLFGHRGIGKTSIAKVAEFVLRLEHPGLVVKAISCDSRMDFLDITSACIANTDISMSDGELRSPVKSAEVISTLRGFLIIDEIDRLRPDQRTLLSEFMKTLSDKATTFCLCAVGIAQTATEIFHGHLSIHRCLNEIHVKQLDGSTIAKIVDTGFDSLKQAIDAQVVVDIARLSLGFPSNAVLICRYVAEGVMRLPIPIISANELRRGLKRLLLERGTTSRELLRHISSNDKNLHKSSLLLSAALIKREDFTYDELYQETRNRCSIDRRTFDNICLGFCLDGPEHVFDNFRPNVLRFSDPRLPMMLFIERFLAEPERQTRY